MCRGSIREGETLLLGPSDNGAFKEVQVGTVHRNRLPCRLIQAGQAASVALVNVKREHLRKVGVVWVLYSVLSPVQLVVIVCVCGVCVCVSVSLVVIVCVCVCVSVCVCVCVCQFDWW